MGVEYQIRCSEHKERVVLHKLRETYEPVRMIVEGVFKSSELLNLPNWVKPLIDERSMWQIKTALEFRERHPKCDLFLWNDHADFGDEEGPFYPEMDKTKPLPRTKEFEKNILEKTRMYIEFEDRDTHEGPFITNRYALPYGYEKREDLLVKIPVTGPIKKLVSKWNGMEEHMLGASEHIEFIYVTEDGRLFKYSPMGSCGEFITEEKLKKDIDIAAKSHYVDFKVIEFSKETEQ